MKSDSRKGPAPDRATDDRIVEIAEQLEALGLKASHANVALILSVERGEVISRHAVRSRRERMALRETS